MNNADGGAPNGNIRQGFLFRTDRGVAFVDRAGAGATTPNAVQTGSGQPQLQFSPGRIDPTNPAFDSSRKPLAGEFTFAGRTVFVVGNHWNSKGGDDADFGRFQPPVLNSEVQRQQQANAVTAFVEQIQAVDANANIIVAGDLNDFQFSAPVTTLTNAGYTSLVTTLPVGERYGYVFDGNSQVLDHIVASNNLVPIAEYDAVHINSEFEVQQSDHDPSVARFHFRNPSRPGVVKMKTQWSLGESLTTGTPTTDFSLGTQPLAPIMGDWDGNDTRTPGLSKAGVFSLYNTVPPGPAPDLSFAFGNRRGFPVAGDFDGDGVDDVAVYDDGTWEIRLTGTGATSTVTGFGTGSWPNTVPVAGDWDGDGTDGIGFFRNGTWTLRQTTTGGDLAPFTYRPGRNPYPVVGDWDGDGIDTVGVKARKGSTWQLNNANDPSAPEIAFDLGTSTDLPVAW
ncbi:MAG TPA: hypothetical protein VGP53_09335 [Acidimicrobiales bacterium]|nr:hypothetical protein [Acidimicrobiales bacterium]